MKRSLYCKDCGTEIFADLNMVMLKDDIWKAISDDPLHSYCACCIENRLERPIVLSDFKPPSMGVEYLGIPMILCNAYWVYNLK